MYLMPEEMSLSLSCEQVWGCEADPESGGVSMGAELGMLSTAGLWSEPVVLLSPQLHGCLRSEKRDVEVRSRIRKLSRCQSINCRKP